MTNLISSARLSLISGLACSLLLICSVTADASPKNAKDKGGKGKGKKVVSNWHNSSSRTVPEDVNNDGIVSTLDAVVTLQLLDEREIIYLDGTFMRSRFPGEPMVDVNGDGHLSPIDPLRIINTINNK